MEAGNAALERREMAAKQLLPNQCTPLHFLYGPADCCLCEARAEMERFKTMVRTDLALILALLPRHSDTRKLMAERYGVEIAEPSNDLKG